MGPAISVFFGSAGCFLLILKTHELSEETLCKMAQTIEVSMPKKVKVKRRQILFWRQSTPLKPNSGTWMWGDLFSQRKSHLKAITWRFFVTFLGWLSDPFKGLSDLQLGDEKGTLNHLESLSFQILRWLFSGDAGFQPLSLGNSGVDQAKMALVWVVGSSALDIGEVDRHLQKIKVIGAPWYIFYLRATPWNLAAKTPPESSRNPRKDVHLNQPLIFRCHLAAIAASGRGISI